MYKTNIVNDFNDLFSAIEAISQEIGFNVQRENNKLIINKNSAFFYFEYLDVQKSNPEMLGYGARINFTLLKAYNPLLNINRQDGFLTTIETNGIFLPFIKYHAFYHQNYFYLVLEMKAGIFIHFGLGFVNNTAFFYIPESNTYAHNGKPFDMNTLLLYKGEVTRTRDRVYGDYNIAPLQLDKLVNASPSRSTGVTPLFPLLVFSRLKNGNAIFHGQAPDIRALNVANFLPAESYMLGNDEWIVFPVRYKRFPDEPMPKNQTLNSDLYGVAYRKIP